LHQLKKNISANAQEMIAPDDMKNYSPSQVLIVTTGSQAEPRAQLSLAAVNQSAKLKIRSDDLILYRYLGWSGG